MISPKTASRTRIRKRLRRCCAVIGRGAERYWERRWLRFDTAAGYAVRSSAFPRLVPRRTVPCRLGDRTIVNPRTTPRFGTRAADSGIDAVLSYWYTVGP